jgi:hypothetical protein
MASPAHAQLEPESFTILKTALNEHPPNPAVAAMVLIQHSDPFDRANLQKTWLASLENKATGTAAEKRKKLAEMLDAFDDTFTAGDRATHRARTFIQLRDELLARKTPGNEIEQSASVFVDRLRALPEADRHALREFGRLVKRKIEKLAQ